MAKTYQDKRARKRGGVRPWCISFVGMDGKRHRERTSATTKEEAQAILRKRLSDITKAKLTDAPSTEALKPVIFEVFLREEYLPHCKATHTAATYYGDRSLSNCVLPFFGKMTLRSITPGVVQRFIDQLAGRVLYKGKPYQKQISPATVNRQYMFISGLLSEAVRRGYIDRNPASRLGQLPEHNDILRWLTDSEEERLLAFMPDFLQPVVNAALHTGARKRELLRLKWVDLDFEQRLVRITQAKNHRTRYIPMNERLFALLESIPKFVGKKGPSPYVFTNAETETHFVNIDASFRGACRKAGFTDVTFHTLRHTFASRLVQAGVPLNTVRELLGHGSMQVTMRYAHLAPNNLREAVATLEKKKPTEGAEKAARMGKIGR